MKEVATTFSESRTPNIDEINALLGWWTGRDLNPRLQRHILKIRLN